MPNLTHTSGIELSEDDKIIKDRIHPLTLKISHLWCMEQQARLPRVKWWQATRDFWSSMTKDSMQEPSEWNNTTNIPILQYVIENLRSKYIKFIFPLGEEWFKWVPDNPEDLDKAKYFEKLLKTNIRLENFKDIISQSLVEWMLFGNILYGVNTEVTKKGVRIPKIFSINILDFVLDSSANTFEEGYLIVRTKVRIEKILMNSKYSDEAKEELKKNLDNLAPANVYKYLNLHNAYVDGFYGTSSLTKDDDFIEVLEYHGAIYDEKEEVIKENVFITIANRTTILSIEEEVERPYIHIKYRPIPKNPYGAGIGESLLGIQYQIDKTINAVADTLDFTRKPVVLIKSDGTLDFEYIPGAVANLPLDAEIQIIRPDLSALGELNILPILERFMKLFSGAREEGVGIRTPGEKTAFEVDALTSGANELLGNYLPSYEQGVNKLLQVIFQTLLTNYSPGDILQAQDTEEQVQTYILSDNDFDNPGAYRAVGIRNTELKSQKKRNLMELLQLAETSTTGQLHLNKREILEALVKNMGFAGNEFFKPYEGLEELKRDKIAQTGSLDNTEQTPQTEGDASVQ